MSRFLDEKYASLDAYVPGEQPQDKKYIKLNTNESPYPPPPSVAEAAAKAAASLQLYSDPECCELRRLLADELGVGAENIILSNGSDEALNFAFMAFSGCGVTFADVTYGFYRVFADLHRLQSHIIPLRADFTLSPDDYVDKGSLIVIANPNAPTGLVISLDDVEYIVKSNPRAVVLIDEAYIDFGGDSALPLIKKYDNLLVVRTFSKSRSLAGARLGYAIAQAGLIEDLNKIKYSTNPYNVNSMTLAAGYAAIKEKEYYTRANKDIIAVREMTAKRLRDSGFEVLPSNANFIFTKYPGFDGKMLYTSFKEAGILVRHFPGPRTGDFIRVSIGRKEEMDTFINTAVSIVKK